MRTPTLSDYDFSERIDDGASRATEIGRKATTVIDDKRDAVAQGIDSMASTLTAKADRLPGGGKVASAAYTAAEALEDAAGYVRDQDLRGMLSDVKGIVKRHPGATLLTVAAFGFVLARAMSRN